jgi:hypothetical protein
MTASTTPTLSADAKAKLDALLTEQAAVGNLPALFYGLTNADGDIYFNCKGKKNEGDPSEGLVDDKTSECRENENGMSLISLAWCLHSFQPSLSGRRPR